MKNPFLSSKDLKNTLQATVSSRTIRNRLIKKDLKAYSVRKVPLLSKKNIVKRLSFAKRHLARKNWKNVLWSDETKINLFGSDGKTFDPKYTKKNR